ncbi:outer membrane protein assembly factor BamE (lipoprotein component of BamABCDE complex) [Sphingomonas vulcanisoli]|uniref:Outer membrane protein assembly factor BamE (Lipoprotein component of BamABCDE complex) n=1 Tax=Sphingomonas vulcanisoli TaxID=1658060 RepID=A0ABX0TR95_9SPHN|nr:outer membrane protein assembly factor BamE [Sphingomonas vulcanisoli]NIJ08048.1 outer membrane protein assembly factor BamE (lipoprotein component of BamABCDE complex) [Sphingomonas vulcanisoli]
MAKLMKRKSAALLLSVAALGLGGCTRVLDHQGYVLDPVLAGGIEPGIDNRNSVEKTLGRPSLVSEFDGGQNWYYWSRGTSQFAAGTPKPVAQAMLTVRFSPAGDVTDVQHTKRETIRYVSLFGRTTPTLGRKRNFFSELFGNIGAGGRGAAPTADKPN